MCFLACQSARGGSLIIRVKAHRANHLHKRRPRSGKESHTPGCICFLFKLNGTIYGTCKALQVMLMFHAWQCSRSDWPSTAGKIHGHHAR